MHQLQGITGSVFDSFGLKMDKEMVMLAKKKHHLYSKTITAPSIGREKGQPNYQRLTSKHQQRVITRTNQSRRASFSMTNQDQDMYNKLLRSRRKSRPLKEDFSQKLDFSVSKITLGSKKKLSRPVSSVVSRQSDILVEQSVKGLKYLFVHRRPDHRRCYTVTQSDRNIRDDTTHTNVSLPRRPINVKNAKRELSLQRGPLKWGEDDPWMVGEKEEDTNRGCALSRMGFF